jgi:hypothetical protein
MYITFPNYDYFLYLSCTNGRPLHPENNLLSICSALTFPNTTAMLADWVNLNCGRTGVARNFKSGNLQLLYPFPDGTFLNLPRLAFAGIHSCWFFVGASVTFLPYLCYVDVLNCRDLPFWRNYWGESGPRGEEKVAGLSGATKSRWKWQILGRATFSRHAIQRRFFFFE